ncbi:discoidin domain-containing protein [Amycolatopsis sp. NPDC059657]|uniref:discoidin domain-containing protein n=1 Tax=Amycolatopsis sp. NPDC059657 TaxID=3346899 RepID=UPI00366B3FDE
MTMTATSAAADVLLSQGKITATSSQESSSYAGKYAVDGSTTTRWASAEGSDPQWIRVDLGQSAAVHRVKLNWEVAYAKRYRIELSADGTTWTTVDTNDAGDGGIDDRTGLTGRGRYVRVVGTARGTSYGYSLWELQVYGVTDTTGDTQPPSTPAGLKADAVAASSVALSWTASTDNVAVDGYDILRGGTVVGTSATNSYTDTTVSPETAYSYTVRARDGAGNVSGVSTALAVTTPAGGGGGSFVLAAAGDIAEQCTASSSSCIHPKTAALVQAMNPAAVITMGDNQYDDAHYSDYTNYYDKTWGKFKSITKPSVGNHDTYDSPPFAGYEKYFGTIAKPDGKRYYSWNMGNWHFISLDSNDFVVEEGDGLNAAADPPQVAWLKADLAANTKGCVAAYFHHPRWSSGDHGDNSGAQVLWQPLVDAKVDLVLNGHDHHYERFIPQDANGNANPAGPVEILGGMGGAGLYPLKTAHATTAKMLKTHGVLKLTMTDNSFTSQLIGLDSKVLDSSPTYTCH